MKRNHHSKGHRHFDEGGLLETDVMPRGMAFGVRRGDFRFIVLMALSEKPMHGYALIQEIGRTYLRPVSAGLIYPTLQELDDMGYITHQKSEGKKIYTLTAEGKQYLEDNRDVVERLRTGREYAGRVGRFSFMRELRDMQTMALMNEEYIDEEKMKKIQEILAGAKKKMASIVFK
jgi:DNA-binding PadR family transcriptional regulator